MMRSLSSFAFLLLLLCSPGISVSQNAWTVFNTGNSPLTDNAIRCIAIDPAGKKWVGTDYGLAVYDDVSWTIFQTFNSDLPDNSIRSIAFDLQGNAWIGTFNGGLAFYDGTNWTVYNTFNSGLPDDFVKCIAIDTAGAVWAGTLAGLAHFDGTIWDIYDINNSMIGSNNIGSVHIDPVTNFLSVGTVNGGLAIHDTSGWNAFNIWNSTLPDNTILGVDRDSSGTLWMATPASGMSAYLGGSLFLTLNGSSSSIASNSLTCLKNAGSDRFWVGSVDSGLIKKDGMNFTCYNTLNSGCPDNYIYSVAVDSGGVVWVGTQQGGLARFDPSLLSGISASPSVTDAIVYPVPASTTISITGVSEFDRTEIVSVSGQTIAALTPGPDNRLNIESIPDGVYLLRVIANETITAMGRFVVVR